MPIGIVLADDHPVLRQGLKVLLQENGFAVVGECGDGIEALALVEKLRPDLTILDISMPNLNGMDAALEIQRRCPRTKTMLLTAHREQQYALSALRSGVKGYVLKQEAGTSLIDAVREVCKGNLYLSPGAFCPLVEAWLRRPNSRPDPLSARESQILQFIADGKTNKEIAEQLNLTVKTAESYRTSLMEKLDIHNTAGLVRYAVRRCLIKA
jgi:two-component system, NarL family, response regulator NreC